jgi:hypothetical protein
MGNLGIFNNKCKKLKIIAVRLCDTGNACQRITAIKYAEPIKPMLLTKFQEYKECPCSLTIEQVISMMNEGYKFFVEGENKSETQVISVRADGRKYIRTAPNDTDDDNLLSLPEF